MTVNDYWDGKNDIKSYSAHRTIRKVNTVTRWHTLVKTSIMTITLSLIYLHKIKTHIISAR
jgi:uncharacterized protein (DUF983 family)